MMTQRGIFFCSLSRSSFVILSGRGSASGIHLYALPWYIAVTSRLALGSPTLTTLSYPDVVPPPLGSGTGIPPPGIPIRPHGYIVGHNPYPPDPDPTWHGMRVTTHCDSGHLATQIDLLNALRNTLGLSSAIILEIPIMGHPPKSPIPGAIPEEVVFTACVIWSYNCRLVCTCAITSWSSMDCCCSARCYSTHWCSSASCRSWAATTAIQASGDESPVSAFSTRCYRWRSPSSIWYLRAKVVVHVPNKLHMHTGVQPLCLSCSNTQVAALAISPDPLMHSPFIPSWMPLPSSRLPPACGLKIRQNPTNGTAPPFRARNYAAFDGRWEAW